jgi:hypothetical protein
MLTPAHTLLSCGLLTARNSTPRNLAVLAGAIAPDLPMVGMFVYDRYVQGLDEGAIWEGRYWTDAWQIPTAIGHSIPIALVILAIGLAARWQAVTFFALSVLVHIAGDLPFHTEDAHMHLWPLSRYKFISPVSYYDPRHYGNIMHWVELGLMVAMMAVLWRRFEARWVRVACGCGIALAVAMPVYFTLQHYLAAGI